MTEEVSKEEDAQMTTEEVLEKSKDFVENKDAAFAMAEAEDVLRADRVASEDKASEMAKAEDLDRKKVVVLEKLGLDSSELKESAISKGEIAGRMYEKALGLLEANIRDLVKKHGDHSISEVSVSDGNIPPNILRSAAQDLLIGEDGKEKVSGLTFHDESVTGVKPNGQQALFIRFTMNPEQ